MTTSDTLPPPSPTEPRVRRVSSDRELRAAIDIAASKVRESGEYTYAASLAADLLDTRALLREIKQNIDENGPDRPDLYKRLCDLAAQPSQPEEP
jgi:hypothetical protein